MSPGRRSSLRGAAAMLVVTLLAGACGVPESGPARTVDPGDVPHNLREATPTASSAARGQDVTSGPSVYLTAGERLVRLGLEADAPDRPTLVDALQALSAGPTQEEQKSGLGTAIPAGLELQARTTVGGLVEIDLVGAAAHPDVDQNALAAGQIVLTATSVPGVDSVVLTRQGQRVDPALPNGELAAGREVTAADYVPLVTSSSPVASHRAGG